MEIKNLFLRGKIRRDSTCKDILKILFIFIAFFVILPLCAAEKKFPQRIEWNANANVLEYKVEVQNIATGRSETIKTEKNSTELSLVPGKYRYRVTAYDFLGKAASISNWTNFEVYKANTPKIQSIQRNIVVPENAPSVGIDVNISDVNEASKFELVSENLEGAITANDRSKMQGGSSETEKITHLDFKAVPPGKWRLRVTNASGLSSISDVITVEGQKTYTEAEVAALTAAAVVAAEEALRHEFLNTIDERVRQAEADKIAKAQAEEERKRLEAEEAERKRLEEEEAQRRAEEERIAAEKRAEEERIAAEKEAKRQAKLAKKNQPYKWKDISIVGGVGYTASIYDSTIKDYYESSMVLCPTAKIKFMPFGKKDKYGVEVGFSRSKFEKNNDFYSAELISTIFDIKFVWQKALIGPLFLSTKVGIGADFIQRKIEYTSGEDTNKGASANASYKNTTGTLGLSLFYMPVKFIVLEVGADFTHVFSSSLGFVTPYACLGFRF